MFICQIDVTNNYKLNYVRTIENDVIWTLFTIIDNENNEFEIFSYIAKLFDNRDKILCNLIVICIIDCIKYNVKFNDIVDIVNDIFDYL